MGNAPPRLAGEKSKEIFTVPQFRHAAAVGRMAHLILPRCPPSGRLTCVMTALLRKRLGVAVTVSFLAAMRCGAFQIYSQMDHEIGGGDTEQVNHGWHDAVAMNVISRPERLGQKDPRRLLRSGRLPLPDFLKRQNALLQSEAGYPTTQGVFVTRTGHVFVWSLERYILALQDEDGREAHLLYEPGIRRTNLTRLASIFPWQRDERLSHLVPPSWSEIKFVRNAYHGSLPKENVESERILEALKSWKVRHDFVTWKDQWMEYHIENRGNVRCGVLVTDNRKVYYWTVWSDQALQLFDEQGSSCLLVSPAALKPADENRNKP